MQSLQILEHLKDHREADVAAAAAVWGLGRFFPDRAVEALDYIANNNELEKGLRCYTRRATKEVWEGLRLDAEAPSLQEAPFGRVGQYASESPPGAAGCRPIRYRPRIPLARTTQ